MYELFHILYFTQMDFQLFSLWSEAEAGHHSVLTGCIIFPGYEIYYVLPHSLQSPDLGNTLLLSSKHGQQYQCVLPLLENLEKKKEENQHITKDEIPQLLEPMKKKCLYNVSFIFFVLKKFALPECSKAS